MGKLAFGKGAVKTAAATKSAPAKQAPASKHAGAKPVPAKKTPEKVIEAEAEVLPPEKPAKGGAPAKATPAKSVPAKAPAKTTALATAPAPAGDVEGDIDASDLRLPRLNLVNPTSTLATEQDFPVGGFVVEKELIVAERDGSLDVVVLHMRKRFQQKLPWGEQRDEPPIICNTKEEVLENGGTLNYSQEAIDDERYYQKMADFVLALRAPDDLPEEELHRFPLEMGGSRWGRFVFTVAGGSYATFAVPVITARQGKLRALGLPGGVWSLSSVKKSGKGNVWYVPAVKFSQIIDETEELEFFNGLASESIPEPDDAGE